MQRILLVEEDETNAKMLRYLLNDEGYEVETADSTEAAIELLEQQTVDLVISETKSSGIDGLQLCREVRRRFRIPVIFISHRVTVKDKIAGFDAGAYDYIVKPYEPAEVMVRIWALLRRNNEFAASESSVRNNDLHFDPLSGTVHLFRNDTTVTLTAKEKTLLHYLVSHPGRTLTRDALMIRVWGYEFDSSNNQLDVYISRLRNKLEENPSRPVLILTVRGTGYRFQPSEVPQHHRARERGEDET